LVTNLYAILYGAGTYPTMPAMPPQDDRAFFLPHLLNAVETHGFNLAAVTAASQFPGQGLALFPHGLPEIMRYWGEYTTAMLAEWWASHTAKPASTTQKIAALIEGRLNLLPLGSALKASQWLALHPAVAAQVSWRTADALWRLAGDTSTDWNYYTKRLLLAGVYQQSMLAWLGGCSGEDLSAFISRRLAAATAIPKTLGALLPKPLPHYAA
jgi:ubiquinone biosynthesis protein COQ9